MIQVQLSGAVIDTSGGWNGTSTFGVPLGEPGANFTPLATYGQTFIPPSGEPVLHNFSFHLSDSMVFKPDPLDFAFYVMAWAGDRATGPILYESGMRTTGITHSDYRLLLFVGLEAGLLETKISNPYFLKAGSQ